MEQKAGKTGAEGREEQEGGWIRVGGRKARGKRKEQEETHQKECGLDKE